MRRPDTFLTVLRKRIQSVTVISMYETVEWLVPEISCAEENTGDEDEDKVGGEPR